VHDSMKKSTPMEIREEILGNRQTKGTAERCEPLCEVIKKNGRRSTKKKRLSQAKGRQHGGVTEHSGGNLGAGRVRSVQPKLELPS